MAVLTKIPNTPINEIDVRDTLNANGGNTNDQWSNLCGAAGKAKYTARYKPVARNVNFCQDHDPNGANYVKDWWKAYIVGDTYKSGRCGVDYPTYTSTASLQGVANPATLWGHDYPDGGASQPYRITDFAGYDPQARDLIASAVRNPTTGGIIIIGGNANSNVAVVFNNNLGTSALDYTEIGYRTSNSQWLKDLYFGYVAISEDGKAHGAVSHEYTMAELNSVTEGDYAATTDHNVFLMLSTQLFNKAAKYKVYPCLFLAKQSLIKSSSAIAISSGYIPLPCAPIEVETTNAADLFVLSNLSASAPAAGGYFTVYFRFTNKYDAPITITPSNPTSYFKVRAFRYASGTNPSDYPNKEYKEEKIQSTFTCPANSTINVSAQTTINVDKGYMLDLQVQYFYGTTTNIQVSDAFVNPFE